MYDFIYVHIFALRQNTGFGLVCNGVLQSEKLWQKI